MITLLRYIETIFVNIMYDNKCEVQITCETEYKRNRSSKY